MKRSVVGLLILVLVTTGVLAEGKKDTAVAGAPLKITVMTTAYSTDPVKPDSDAIKMINDYCGVNLEIIHVPSTAYGDKFNLTLASGEIPMVILALDRGASVFQAIRQGAFWEIGPYLKEFPNLSQASDVVLWNSSFDGKVYGLYRARPLGRNGVIYRSDWLDNLGLRVPQTLDEFYNMLYAFTYNDPDKNGKADTYGMVMTQYMGPFDNVLTWFGGPNGWGFNDAGEAIPAFMTKEYQDTLHFFKKLYDEKIINDDFAVFDPGKWNDPMLAGEAGCAIDVTDRSNKINTEFERSVPGAKMDIMSPPAGPKGQRSLATAGFAGVFLFSKQAIKDEATLRKVLGFFDKLGDKAMLDLCGYGIEGRHWDLVDGYIKVKPATDKSFQANEFNDLNQILPFIPNAEGTPQYQTWWVAKGAEIQKYNEKIVVGNPMAPFTSATFATKGAQLDNLVNDARIQYIVGQIDDKGWDEMVATWRKTGGDEVIREYNEQYKKYAK